MTLEDIKDYWKTISGTISACVLFSGVIIWLATLEKPAQWNIEVENLLFKGNMTIGSVIATLLVIAALYKYFTSQSFKILLVVAGVVIFVAITSHSVAIKYYRDNTVGKKK